MKNFTLLTIVFFAFFANGQFGQIQSISQTFSSPRFIANVDMDGDSDVDAIVYSNSSQNLAWMENDGFGNFSSPTTLISSVISPSDVEVTDMNGDGLLDVILVSGFQDKLHYYENQGNLQFQLDTSININSPTTINAIDLDNDNDLDIVVGTFASLLVSFENIGSGVLGSQQTISTTIPSIRSVDVSDIDNDMDTDLLVSSSVNDEIWLFENLGGTLGVPTLISDNVDEPYVIICADLNNNGFEDLISISNTDGKLCWFQNLGNGTYGPETIIQTGIIYARYMSVGDMNGDGFVDIIAPNTAYDETHWYQNNAGTIAPGQLLIDNSTPTNMAIFDYSNNGTQDVLFANPELLIYEGLGNGSVASPVNYSNNIIGLFDIEMHDLDLDGDKDLIYLSLNQDIAAWQENLGQGDFGPSQLLTNTLSLSHYLTIGDCNGDGFPDILINNTSADEVVWIPNLGNGNFGTSQQAVSIPAPYVIAMADLDGDGIEDLIVSSNNTNSLRWCKNFSTGTFGTPQDILATPVYGLRDLEFVDEDNDGDLDIIFSCNGDHLIGFSENDGSGNFSPHVTITNSIGPVEFMEAEDMNFDGFLDIVYRSDSQDEIGWMPGLGVYSWGSPISIAPTTSSIYGMEVADVDDNGYPDIVYSTNVISQSKWIGNSGNGNFETPISYTSTSISRGLNLYDLDNDSDLDIITGQGTGIVWIENTFTYPNKLSGTVFFDANQNGVRDTSEQGLNILPTSISPSSLSSYTSNDGSYFYAVAPGTYDVNHVPLPDSIWSHQTPISYNRTISAATPNHDSLDFGYYPDSLIKITSTHLVGGFPRCNDTVRYTSMVKNIGSTLPSGYVHLILDDSVSLVQTFTTPDSIVGQNIYWSVDSLFYFDVSEFKYELHLPDYQSMGDTITNEMYFYGLDTSGNIIDTGYYKLEQILVCAYDPNDKSVYPRGDGPEGFVANDQYLEYLVRFQNTGNDTALFVEIRDTLDPSLDWTTMQPVSSSHNFNTLMDNQGRIRFRFPNIYLPDSTTNEPESKGYILFRVKMLPGLQPETEIYNSASIYFDQNPPILTNTVLNTIEIPEDLSVEEFSKKEDWYLFPNPTNGSFQIRGLTAENLNTFVQIVDLSGRQIGSMKRLDSNDTTLTIDHLNNGIYLVRLINKQGEGIGTKRILLKR